MSPFIIPFFIVHEGCPYRCIFCDQRQISGKNDSLPISGRQIAEEIAAWLARPRRYPESDVQVAFYGGTFTSLTKERQDELLGAVQPYLQQGLVQSIRISTRPDGIRPDTAGFLAERGVKLVEIGVQSMDGKVLDASGRGYHPEQVEEAFAGLRGGGLDVGGQLMVGLPGETTSGAINSAIRLAKLQPICVRLYPTLVMRGSVLENDYIKGRYQPLSFNRALGLTARLKTIFDEHNIPVIRIGLQAGETLEKNVLAGPYHPAFGEKVLSRILFNKVRAFLHGQRHKSGSCLSIAAADESLFRGSGNCSMKRLERLGLLDGIEVVFSPDRKRNTVGIF